jgi:hypothetical protein
MAYVKECLSLENLSDNLKIQNTLYLVEILCHKGKLNEALKKIKFLV